MAFCHQIVLIKTEHHIDLQTFRSTSSSCEPNKHISEKTKVLHLHFTSPSPHIRISLSAPPYGSNWQYSFLSPFLIFSNPTKREIISNCNFQMMIIFKPHATRLMSNITISLFIIKKQINIYIPTFLYIRLVDPCFLYGSQIAKKNMIINNNKYYIII